MDPTMERRENFSSMATGPNGVNKPFGAPGSNQAVGGGGGGGVGGGGSPGGAANLRGSSPGAKKLVIKNLRAKPVLPDEFESRAVAKLKAAVTAIQQQRPMDATLEELYGAVENLCVHGFADKVYSSLKQLVERHVQEAVKPFLGESLDKLIFMKRMNECWSSHCRQMIMTRSIFLYLDRTYVLQHASVLSIWEMGLDAFRTCVLAHQLVQARTVEGALMLIEQERHGDQVDRSLLKSLLRMLSDLQIYREAFEKRFLSATEKLYAEEGQRLVQERDVPEYLLHVEKRLKEENDRLIHYLDMSSKWQLVHTVEKQLISEHLVSCIVYNLSKVHVVYAMLLRFRAQYCQRAWTHYSKKTARQNFN